MIDSAQRGILGAVNTTELLVEKVKSLPEHRAKAVLNLIREFMESHQATAAELTRLLPAERRNGQSQQARQAEVLLRHRPDMIAEEEEEPLYY